MAATPASPSAATTRTGNPYIYVDFISGAWGGRPWADGLDGNTNMFANMASFSVEVIEAENPLEVLDYEMVPDTGGAGKFRGGVAQRRRPGACWPTRASCRSAPTARRIAPTACRGGGPGAARPQQCSIPACQAERSCTQQDSP